MTVEIQDWKKLLGMGVFILLLALGGVGRWMTPRPHGEAQVLTPARWHALRLERRTLKETEALVRDARELRNLLEQGRPSPVDAMLLAERIYAHHRTGTAATGPARETLIAAAEAVTRYAAGTMSREEAVITVDRAFLLIEDLRVQAVKRYFWQHSLPYIEVSKP